MKAYNSLIVEDEQHHLTLLTQILSKKCPQINVDQSVNTLGAAKQALSEKKYDIVFMDINVQGENAFDLLKTVPLTDSEVIITTSHKQHALDAFKHLASGYLMKPLVLDEVVQVVNNSKNKIDVKRLASMQMENGTTISSEPLKRLAVSSMNEVEIIPISEILYLKSEGKYTLFHLKNNKQIVSSKNLGYFEKMLVNNNFFRIHYSYLANVDYAVKIEKRDGSYLEICNNLYLPISKRKADAFYQYLGIK